MSESSEYDITLILGSIVVFGLPLTLLVPGFSVWDVVPKTRVIRFHLFRGYLTWPMLNAALVTGLLVFFCLYLEIRKRKLDDMVESVLTVSQVTDVTMGVEKDRQAAAVKACVDLLDTTTDHYENLILLSDDLRRREKNKQKPPTIELSSSDFT